MLPVGVRPVEKRGDSTPLPKTDEPEDRGVNAGGYGPEAGVTQGRPRFEVGG